MPGIKEKQIIKKSSKNTFKTKEPKKSNNDGLSLHDALVTSTKDEPFEKLVDKEFMIEKKIDSLSNTESESLNRIIREAKKAGFKIDPETAKALKVFALTVVGVGALFVAGGLPILGVAELTTAKLIEFFVERGIWCIVTSIPAGIGTAAIVTSNTFPEDTLGLHKYWKVNNESENVANQNNSTFAADQLTRKTRETTAFIESLISITHTKQPDSFANQAVSQTPILEKLSAVLSPLIANFDDNKKKMTFTLLGWLSQTFNKYEKDGYQDIKKDLFINETPEEIFNNEMPHARRNLESLLNSIKEYFNKKAQLQEEKDLGQEILIMSDLEEIVENIKTSVDILDTSVSNILDKMHTEEKLVDNENLLFLRTGFSKLQEFYSALKKHSAGTDSWFSLDNLRNNSTEVQTFEAIIPYVADNSLVIGLLDAGLFLNENISPKFFHENKHLISTTQDVDAEKNLDNFIKRAIFTGAEKINKILVNLKIALLEYINKFNPKELEQKNKEELINFFNDESLNLFLKFETLSREFYDIIKNEFISATDLYNSLISKMELKNEYGVISNNFQINLITKYFQYIFSKIGTFIDDKVGHLISFKELLKNAHHPMLNILFFIHYPDSFLKLHSFLVDGVNELTPILQTPSQFITPEELIKRINQNKLEEKKILEFQKLTEENWSYLTLVSSNIFLLKQQKYLPEIEKSLTEFKKICKNFNKLVSKGRYLNLIVKDGELEIALKVKIREIILVVKNLLKNVKEITPGDLQFSELKEAYRFLKEYFHQPIPSSMWNPEENKKNLVEKFEFIKDNLQILEELEFGFNDGINDNVINILKMLTHLMVTKIDDNKVVKFLRDEGIKIRKYIEFFQGVSEYQEMSKITDILLEHIESVDQSIFNEKVLSETSTTTIPELSTLSDEFSFFNPTTIGELQGQIAGKGTFKSPINGANVLSFSDSNQTLVFSILKVLGIITLFAGIAGTGFFGWKRKNIEQKNKRNLKLNNQESNEIELIERPKSNEQEDYQEENVSLFNNFKHVSNQEPILTETSVLMDINNNQETEDEKYLNFNM